MEGMSRSIHCSESTYPAFIMCLTQYLGIGYIEVNEPKFLLSACQRRAGQEGKALVVRCPVEKMHEEPT